MYEQEQEQRKILPEIPPQKDELVDEIDNNHETDENIGIAFSGGGIRSCK